MKATVGPIYDEIRREYVNSALPVLTAEWNMNRYFRAYPDNTPEEQDEGYDTEMFPIESIVLPDRPEAGIVKGLVGQARVSADHYDDVPAARYYTVSPDDQYKYWQSPLAASTSAPYNITDCNPYIEYVEEAIDPEDVDEVRVGLTVKANKISFTVENTWASPDVYDIQVKLTPVDTWTTVASNIAVPAGGKVQIYYNGTAWTTTKNLDNPIDLHAVRLVVTSMNTSGAFFNLIELAACLELDLSADIASIDDSANMGETDFITPLGTISSNVGSLTLFNEHRKYTNDNPVSVLYGLLDKNVKFDLKYSYADGDIQQFVLYSEFWSEGLEETSVELKDGTTFFMSVKPQPVLYRNVSIQEAVWRLCDLVGYTNYLVESLDDAPNSSINIFWTTGEETLWEVFQELSRGTQTAIYFDAYGRLRVKTREIAFDDAQTPAWTLRENEVGTDLPDIITLSETDHHEANKVTVTYQPTDFSEKVGNIVPMEVVWEPEGPVVLRASNLIKSMTADDTVIALNPGDANVWPWRGMCQIEGEWIEYSGKRYVYYDENVKTYATVYSEEHQKKLDAKSNDSKRHLNGYTGNLIVKKRGLYNTEKQAHNVDINGWSTTGIYVTTGLAHTPARGIRHNKQDGTVTLQQGKVSVEQFLLMHRGNAINQGWRRIGTKMKIDDSAHRDKRAGIFFNADELGQGYFLEVIPTILMDGNLRKRHNEIILFSMNDDGSKKLYGGSKTTSNDDSRDNPKGSVTKTDMGAEVAVLQNRWVEIDIFFNEIGSDHHIQVWVDGRLVMTSIITNGSGWKHPWIERFGTYVRGNTSATFEYIYGITKPDNLYDDQEDFMDRIEGGYVGQQWSRDYTYEVRSVRRRFKKKSRKVAQRYQQRFMDEFGPVVHEIRDFDVKFSTDGLPVLESKLFHTNDTQAVCTEYVGDVSGAKFTMANTSRLYAILNGEDALTTRGIGTIDQKLFVYGRPVIQKDAKEIIRRDEWAIRRRGEIETEYQSKWVQNSATAEALADWLTTHWTRSDSVVTAEVFGNPLFELGDVVSIDYQDMDPSTHKFYVTGINTSFDAGITTELTLRRVS